MSKLIVGYGLLGKEMHRQTGWQFFSGKVIGADFGNQYDTIINCVGHTDTYDKEMSKHWESNLRVPKYLVDYCNKNNVKYVHISTDYIYSGSDSNASEQDVPVHNKTWYGYTKLVADALVQLESNEYLICRGTHKPYPFPYQKAWVDQVGNFDFLPIIAKLIIKLINKEAVGVFNVGTELKTISMLCPNIERTFKHHYAPSDVSMNIEKLKKYLS